MNMELKSEAVGADLSLRSRIYSELFQQTTGNGLSITNKLILLLIVCSLVMSVLDTEAEFHDAFLSYLFGIEIVFCTLFMLEYIVRLWAAGEAQKYRGIKGRLRYALTPMALIDLLAFVPTLLTFGVSDAFILRLLRMARMLRFARLGYYSNAIAHVEYALSSRARELLVSLCIAFGLLLLGATMLYIVEGEVQPEIFGSIPRALWWSVATLTTVGYGDVYPITWMGKFCAAIVAFTGVATVALPAGILASAFTESYERKSQ